MITFQVETLRSDRVSNDISPSKGEPKVCVEDDEPVQTLLMCSHCKAFFNNTKALFEHQQVHNKSKMILFSNKKDDSGDESTKQGNTGDTDENKIISNISKRTRTKYRGMFLVIKETDITGQNVTCKAVGTCKRDENEFTARCEACDWTDRESELLQHIKYMHPNISYQCGECDRKFRE